MYYKLLKRAMTGSYDLTYCGYLEYDENTGNTQPAQNDCLQEPYLKGNIPDGPGAAPDRKYTGGDLEMPL